MIQAEKNEYNRKLAARRIAEGCCWRCGDPLHPGSKRLCTNHLLYERNRYVKKTGDVRRGRRTLTSQSPLITDAVMVVRQRIIELGIQLEAAHKCLGSLERA